MPGPSPLTSTPNTLACFTASEIRRLVWLRGIVAAERYLVPIDQPCPDHEQCRRLAFALWLRVTDRLSELSDSGARPLHPRSAVTTVVNPRHREQTPRTTACPLAYMFRSAALPTVWRMPCLQLSLSTFPRPRPQSQSVNRCS